MQLPKHFQRLVEVQIVVAQNFSNTPQNFFSLICHASAHYVLWITMCLPLLRSVSCILLYVQYLGKAAYLAHIHQNQETGPDF